MKFNDRVQVIKTLETGRVVKIENTGEYITDSAGNKLELTIQVLLDGSTYPMWFNSSEIQLQERI